MSPFDAILNISSEQIASARSFLLKTKCVPILDDCPPLYPTFADLCGLPDLSDETIKRILGTSIENPSDSDRHTFSISANSWMVATRPLLVKEDGVGEKITVIDEEGKRHSRVALVAEDFPENGIVGIMYDDGDEELGEVPRSCIWPEIRKWITICSLSKEKKAILSKAVLAFPPPSKTLIENLKTPFPRVNVAGEEFPGTICSALFYGFSSAMLGVSGFETSSQFIEEQKPGVFVKTLRNMWWGVLVFNPLLSLISFAALDVEDIVSHKDMVLAQRIRKERRL